MPLHLLHYVVMTVRGNSCPRFLTERRDRADLPPLAVICLLRKEAMASRVKPVLGDRPMQAQDELDGFAISQAGSLHECPFCKELMYGAIGAEYLSPWLMRNVCWCDNCNQICRTTIGARYVSAAARATTSAMW